jgi:diguanylate cyclase
MSAPMPADERERLALLRELGLLDSAPEPAFDRVTRVVAQALDMPIALVSLIDEHRQWFKSRHGFALQETPREIAICAHAIAADGPTIVHDAREDDRFKDNPLVTGEHGIRFYAAVPLRTWSGVAVGTLCVMDVRPRTLNEAQFQTLLDMGNVVAEEIRARETVVAAQSHADRADAVLAASETRFRSMFELASIGIALVAPDGSWISVNDALCQIVGYAPEDLARLTFRDITHPDDLDADLDLLGQLVDGKIDRYHMNKRYVRKDGRSNWASLSVTKKISAGGSLEYFVSIVQDIQAQKDAEESLHSLRRDLEERVHARTAELMDANRMLSTAIEHQARSAQALRSREAELRAVIEYANDAYISINEDIVVTAWNREAERTFGWTAEEAVGRNLDGLIMPASMGDTHRHGAALYLATGHAPILHKRLELPARRKDGSTLMVEIRVHPVDLGDRKIFCAFLHDITDRKALEVRRDREARHDALTGLPNRRALAEILPLAQARTDRTTLTLAVMFIDLDGFKEINDTHGHDAGDDVLRVVGERLRGCVRRTDSVVRLAGDEFTVVVEGLMEGAAEARRVAEKIVARVSEPIAVQGRIVGSVGASVGVSLYRAGGARSPDELIKIADALMYAAKRGGKGRVALEEWD